MAELPVIGGWALHNPQFPENAALAELNIDLRAMTGSLRYQQQDGALSSVILMSPTRFGARYNLGRFHGLLEAEIRDDRTVEVKLIGTPKATLIGKPTKSAVHWIATQFKGSYDIAGAALALSKADLGFQWTNEGSSFVDARSVDALLEVRRICCFEFVHLAAYLAGRQPVAASGNPMVSGAASAVYSKQKTKVWDGKSIIPKGKIVVGVARAFNNASGFYHVGVALGDGRVVSLGSGSNLHIVPTKGLFGVFYSEVLVGDYPWAQAQNDRAAPLLPP